MKRQILKLLLLLLPCLGFGQDCPTGNGDNIGASVSNGTSHQIYLEWPTDAAATAIYDALQGGALQTAITLNGYVNFGAANEEVINNVTLSKTEVLIPGGNPFRIRSNVPVTTTYNGNFTGTVTFNFNSGAGGGTQECVFSVGVLPIELTYFRAIAMEREVMIKWQTALEINNDYMAVERSQDGRIFSEIGRLAGAGHSTQTLDYEIKDIAPLSGKSYYRLRQVDFDGTTSYSDISTVTFKSDNPGFGVYPTLIQGQAELSIDLTTLPEKAFTVDVFTASGQWLSSHQLTGGSLETLSVAALNPGVFVLKIRNGQTFPPVRIMKIQ